VSPDREAGFEAVDADILRELMNIAFGKAGADLADVLDMFVVLNVPDVQVIPAARLHDHIGAEIRSQPGISVVEQDFWGDFQGNAFLILPAVAGKNLLALLAPEEGTPATGSTDPYAAMDSLEGDTLMEMGNIIIGACVGKLAELLGTVVSYSPPSVSVDDDLGRAIRADLFEPGYSAVVLQTVFSFGNRDVKGFVFLVSSRESVQWLKAALHRFMAQYE